MTFTKVGVHRRDGEQHLVLWRFLGKPDVAGEGNRMGKYTFLEPGTYPSRSWPPILAYSRSLTIYLSFGIQIKRSLSRGTCSKAKG